MNESVIETPLPISVQFDRWDKLSVPVTFTYRSNPAITNVHPIETLAAGGTTLTVTGNSLDAVGDPKLVVSMVHTVTGGRGSDINSSFKRFTSECNSNSSTLMTCQYPKIDIPP